LFLTALIRVPSCEQTRNADVCRQAVAEEANVAAAYKRVQQP
jgi:hypothetical protein